MERKTSYDIHFTLTFQAQNPTKFDTIHCNALECAIKMLFCLLVQQALKEKKPGIKNWTKLAISKCDQSKQIRSEISAFGYAR